MDSKNIEKEKVTDEVLANIDDEKEQVLAELKAKLERGEIDGKEYNRLVMNYIPAELSSSERIDLAKKSARRGISIGPLIGLLALVVFVLGCFWYFSYFRNDLDTKDLPDFRDEVSSSIDSEPVQIDIDNTTRTGTYKFRAMKMTFKAYYDISAVVTSVHDYTGFDSYSAMVPRDVCLAWGDWKDVANNPDYKFYQGDRACGVEHNDPRYYFYDSHTDNPFEVVNINHTGRYNAPFSNNHLIPSTLEIRREISSLKKGDKVRIVGYLVNAVYDNLEYNSSTSRTDLGSHSCEVIYVTSIERI